MVDVLISLERTVLQIESVIKERVFAQWTWQLFVEDKNVVVVDIHVLVHVAKHL